MKKSFYWSIILAFLSIIPGCSGSDTSTVGDYNSASREPIIGFIREVNASSILVLTDITPDQLKDFDADNLSTYHGGAYWIGVRDASTFKKGQKVEVWTNGPIRESYPAQTNADKVVVLDEN